uniref:Fibroblast growth factor 14 n=1 Tax=Homo sapiens TaxID=9606 RepID=A0A9L9PWZ4_HUMAN
MVKPVPLFRRTDFKLLLCNHKDLFFLRVSKLLDCFSPKSMWFLWNIFSKGTHMLQCLCGKSLKKNKNPTGVATPSQWRKRLFQEPVLEL